MIATTTQVKFGKLIDKKDTKAFLSESYNWQFCKKTGFFVRWGENLRQDPDPMLGLPEIVDIEITTKCQGIGGKACRFCYKSNTPDGINMSYERFAAILGNLPPTITQVAFGVDSEATSNPDFLEMAKLCRSKGIIPNVTVANIDDHMIEELSSICGAVAVSRYDNKNICYDVVEKLTQKMEQVNIHQLVAQETVHHIWETLYDIQGDPRLKKLKAIVLLSLKRKGRGKSLKPIDLMEFLRIVNFCLKNKISIGFDSCTAPKFMDTVEDHPLYKKFKTMTESCESGLFSVYINAEGKLFPCSFMEGENDWQEGIDVIKCKDFINEIWFGDRLMKWKKRLVATKDRHGCHNCPVFEV